VFEEQRIHLVSQAANDLNLTFVVDEDQAERVVRDLHAHLFGPEPADESLGPTWTELQAGAQAPRPGEGRWWRRRRDELLALPTPLYVYDLATVERAAASLRALKSVTRVLYAVKANPHAEILRRLHLAGLGFECVSPGELDHVTGLFPDRLPLFTPNFAPRAEYEHAFARGATVTLDNLYPLEAWPDLFRDREVFVRLDPGRGLGHHHHVRTAGTASKFGIATDQLGALAALLDRAGARVIGLHAHVGSGVRDAEAWAATASFLADVANGAPWASPVRVLDLGGGLGVPEKPGDPPLDLPALDRALGRVRAAHPRFELWLEPGRYLVAEAGVLLARVTQLKQKADTRYVGVDTGMNSLIRPALYGAWHEIVNLTRLDEAPRLTTTVVGPICETGDTLGHDRRLPPCSEGDILLVATAGAYGRAMSSRYNLREPAAEHVI
jgi:diaminopimelate decarboxylase/aspartate kinase